MDLGRMTGVLDHAPDELVATVAAGPRCGRCGRS